MNEEQAPADDPLAPDPNKAVDDPEKYSPAQKVALFAGMCKQIGEDLGTFTKAIVENDTGEGYFMTYETVAILSAKLLRAKSGIAGLARILEAALPKDINVDAVVSSVKVDLKGTNSILSSLQSAVLGNTAPLDSSKPTLVQPLPPGMVISHGIEDTSAGS